MRKQLAFKDIVMRLILQMIVAVLISIGVIAISEPTTARADGIEWTVDAAGNKFNGTMEEYTANMGNEIIKEAQEQGYKTYTGEDGRGKIVMPDD